MKGSLRVGDTVWWRGGFGLAAPKKARVTHIEIVEQGEKEGGAPMKSVPWSIKNNIVVDLDSGHWAYGDQIDPI